MVLYNSLSFPTAVALVKLIKSYPDAVTQILVFSDGTYMPTATYLLQDFEKKSGFCKGIHHVLLFVPNYLPLLQNQLLLSANR